MYILINPRKLAPSQYFRQNKLAHCLKDIVSGSTQVKVILHLRPERSYLYTTLDAVRFASRVRRIPPSRRPRRQRNTFFDGLVVKLSQDPCNEEPCGRGSGSGAAPNDENLKEALTQASKFFEDKLDTLEESCKDEVKCLFETYKEMVMSVIQKDGRKLSEHLKGSEDLDPGRNESSRKLNSNDAVLPGEHGGEDNEEFDNAIRSSK